tara:strand:+ start:130 stop:411 length:282 start_codon:yes stop_codon:yes gene_type:complete
MSDVFELPHDQRVRNKMLEDQSKEQSGADGHSKDGRYGGLASTIITKIMGDFGITQEMVDKIKTIIDNVDVQQDEDQTIIRIKTKEITVIINK